MLETQNLTLRKPGPQDIDAAVAFFTSDRAQYVGGPHTPGMAWRHFAAEVGHWDLRGYGMWAFCRKGTDDALGLVGPWYPNDWPETEIGWMAFAHAEGKGLTFEAANAALDHAYGTLGWSTAVSYIDARNTRSIALAERLGATVDPYAPQPKPDLPCLVYRHPVRTAA
ncbi:GNAT family N-acetyltransferase [Pseudaestuariivita sp.]|uniref:GNAT family N-acetyltransferase n=1 Tax=Pseudaestuariivita sp. TaxID=2211669 RepID=UPI00405A26D1